MSFNREEDLVFGYVHFVHKLMEVIRHLSKMHSNGCDFGCIFHVVLFTCKL